MADNREEMQENVIRTLRNKQWRLSHLYKIKDKQGKVVRYTPNEAQQYLYDHRHRRNIIPKARQRGLSTCILIDYLDTILFTPYYKAATLAHREQDSLKLFSSKVKFPYDHIDPRLKPYIPRLYRETTSLLEFSNGSIFSAETRVRSDTVQRLHVSELSALFDQDAARAEEVKTGAFPAAERGIIDVESTMKGRYGTMFELCEQAKDLFDRNVPLTDKDFKFFFFSWYGCKEYRLEIPVEIEPEMERYFGDLEQNCGIVLQDEQKWWYIKEREILGDLMKQEYPATYEESVEVATDSMYFGKQMVRAKHEDRICRIPYNCQSKVYGAMDIGHKDAATAWTFQFDGMEIRFLDYIEREGEHPIFFHNWFDSLEYSVKTLGLPHDAKAVRFGQPDAVDVQFKNLGYDVTVLDRDEHEIFGINKARGMFNQCRFNVPNCKRGLECLDKFRKGWNEKHQCFTALSVHDQYSHGAKGFIYALQFAEIVRGRGFQISRDDYKKLKERHRKVI